MIPDRSVVDVLGMDAKVLRVAANLSLKTSSMPADWKIGRVSPVFKGTGFRMEKSNYRPISVVGHIAKLLEMSVLHQFLTYLTNYNFIIVD